MVALTALSLPILLSAVLVFVASSVVHMVVPWHRNDLKRLPGEDAVREAIRKAGIGPGQYWFPFPENPKDMGSPEMRKKFAEGPVGTIFVMPNGPPMIPKHLVEWFVFCLVVGVFVAYLTGRAFGAGTEYLSVFRYSGTIAFLAYAATHAADPIWKGGSWAVAFKHAVDGLLYGVLTAGIFSWLWP
jgi:hypothetical protein